MNSELPETVICIMHRGSGPGGVQNSNSEHLEALKRRQGRWIVTLPFFRALLGAHNHSAGLSNRDFASLSELLGTLLTPSLTPIFFQDVFVLRFDTLGAGFELPRGPSDPQNH